MLIDHEAQCCGNCKYYPCDKKLLHNLEPQPTLWCRKFVFRIKHLKLLDFL